MVFYPAYRTVEYYNLLINTHVPAKFLRQVCSKY